MNSNNSIPENQNQQNTNNNDFFEPSPQQPSININANMATHLAAVLRTEKEKEARIFKGLSRRMRDEEAAERARTGWAERAGLVRKRREQQKERVEKKRLENAIQRAEAERKVSQTLQDLQNSANSNNNTNTNNSRIARAKNDLVREYMSQTHASENLRKRLEQTVQVQMAKESIHTRNGAIKNRLSDAIRFGSSSPSPLNHKSSPQQGPSSFHSNSNSTALPPIGGQQQNTSTKKKSPSPNRTFTIPSHHDDQRNNHAFLRQQRELKLSPNKRILLSPEAIEILKSNYVKTTQQIQLQQQQTRRNQIQ